jgi:hypothetical protein
VGCRPCKIWSSATIDKLKLSFSCNDEVFLIKYPYNVRNWSYSSVELTLTIKESSFL